MHMKTNQKRGNIVVEKKIQVAPKHRPSIPGEKPGVQCQEGSLLDFWTHHQMRGIGSLVFFCRVTAAQDCLLIGNSPLAYYEINFITSTASSCNIHRFDYIK